MKRVYSILPLILSLCLSGGLRAQDSVEDVLRRDYTLPLRWDNVQGAPAWISGEKPGYNILRRCSEVELAPGQGVCVRIPAYEMLRIVCDKDQLPPDGLEIALSTGSGLLAFTEPVPSVEAHSLLIDPQRPNSMLAHVFRPSHFKDAIRVGLFTSRHVPLQEVASYRDLVDIKAQDKVRITTSVDAEALAFAKWDRGHQVKLRLRGPARYLLETYYRYPRDEQKLPQTYRVGVRDAEHEKWIASVEYVTSHETAHLVFADGEAQVVSRVERGFFDLMENRDYHVVLETSAPLFARLLRSEDPDYLVPFLNAPDPSPAKVAKDLRPDRFQLSPWEMSDATMAGVLDDPYSFPSEQVERTAMRLVRDNRRREGGMMASGLLWNAGAFRRDYPDIRERWREFTGFHTYYRDVPSEGACIGPLKRAYFLSPLLQESGASREWLVFAEQHLNAGFSRMPLATFSPLHTGGTRIVYRFPERATASTIRIAAERGRRESADFWIKIPGENARRFRLLPEPEVDWQATKPTQGEAALTLMGGNTLGVAAAVHREANNLVSAGYFEFPIPPGVDSMELWGGDGSDRLPVAVQCRGSDVYELSADEYGSVVAALGNERQVLPLLVEFLKDAKSSPLRDARPLARQELFNHWEPLRRFIRARYRQFADSVAGSGGMPPAAANLEDVDKLIAEKEYFMAERLARYLYLYARESRIRAGAFARLSEMAQSYLDGERQLLNECVAMATEPGKANAAELCELFRQGAEPELALMLALSLPPGDAKTRELRLAATYAKGWWAQFHSILSEAPDAPDCRVWRAHYLWRKGQYEEALRELEKAADHGRPWLAHVEATREVQARIAAGDAKAFRDWANLESTQPGKKVWKPVSDELVASFKAGITVRALEREKYFHAFIATPEAPLELQFGAPCKVRIECRPIHSSSSDTPIEGWVHINGADDLRRKLPVIANYRSPGLEIVGHDNEQPGTLVWDEFAINGWNQRLVIRPDSGRMFVRVLSEEPEARIGYLPPLTGETAANLFDLRNHLPGKSQHPRPDDAGFGKVVLVDANHRVTPLQVHAPFADPSSAALGSVRERMGRLAPLAQSMPRQTQRDAITRMANLLWNREHDAIPVQRMAVAAAAAEIDKPQPFPEPGSIHAKIVRQTSWEPMLAVEQCAGIREIESEGWSSESPDLGRRLHFLPKLGAREQMISGTDNLVAMLTNKAANKVRLRLSMEVVPFLVAYPMQVKLQMGGDPEQEVVLTANKVEKKFEFNLPAGQTSLRVNLIESQANHFLKVEIDADNEPELLNVKTRRNYFVSTADEPVVARIDGPSWVRIDRLEAGTTLSETRLVANAVETLKLPPAGQEKESLYRLHVLRLDPAKPFHPPAFADRTVESVAPPLQGQSLREKATLVGYRDEFHLGSQEDGTWSPGLGYHSRRAVEEDSFGSRDAEKFWQGDVTHRNYDEDLRTYFRTTLLGRSRDFGEDTFGIEHSLQYRPFSNPLAYTLTGNGFWQDGEWSLSGLGSIGITNELSPKWSHSSALSVFFREMSLADSGDFPGRVDQDIFTPYKFDHRHGLRLSEELSFTPWRDIRVFGGFAVGTNEDVNPFAPDSISFSAGISQRLGPVQLGIDWKGYRFFEDYDRASAVWQNRLHVEALADHWLRNQQRIEVGVSWTHFVEQDENAFMIVARWHFGEGRMFRDFRPGEKPFLKSREVFIPQDRNNEIYQLHGRGSK